MIAVPTLDELISNPALAQNLQPDILRKLLVRAASVQSVLANQLLIVGGDDARRESVEPDEMLTVAEAAKLLRRTARWLWRHQHLPFVRRISNRNLLISKNDLTKWLAAQTVTRKSRARGAA
jgi:hypothetical protein